MTFKKILIILLLSVPFQIELYSKSVLVFFSDESIIVSLSSNPSILFRDTTIDVKSDNEGISFPKSDIISIKIVEEEPSMILPIQQNKFDLNVNHGEVTIKGLEPGSNVLVSSADGKSFSINSGDNGVVSFTMQKFCIVSINKNVSFKLFEK